MRFYGTQLSLVSREVLNISACRDDAIKWKHFPRYWPFVRGIRRSPVNSPHKGQWRGALVFLWSTPWINDWVNTHQDGDLRRHKAHYDVIVRQDGFENITCKIISTFLRDQCFNCITCIPGLHCIPVSTLYMWYTTKRLNIFSWFDHERGANL